jgi:lipopolysaccharide export system ATP-binding protein
MSAVLRAENLVKIYNRRRVVDDVTIELGAGEVIGLLGRNGAGKTTTFQIMIGLVKPEAGSIRLDGQDISRLPTYLRARRGVTYLPQEGSVFLKASVRDNLRLGLELSPYSKGEQAAIAANLLEEMGLAALAAQSAHSLSGGERRRLEICRALILNPKFLLLDEPFTGIDPLTILELQKILRGLKAKGIGMVLTDHNVRDTFRIVDRAYIIDEGRILVEGPPDAVAADETARARFLGKGFKWEPGREDAYSSGTANSRSPNVSPRKK